MQPSHRYAATVAAALSAALLLLVGLAGYAIQHGADQQRSTLASRFAARSATAGVFVGAYAQQTLTKTRVVATAEFSGTPDPEQFPALAGEQGFPAAVLLDADGAALAVAPRAPALLGTSIAAKCAHLRSAVADTPAVSDIVP